MNAAAIQRYAPELRTSAHTNGMKGADLILLTVALAPGGYGVRLSVVLTRSLPARHPSQRLRRALRRRRRPFRRSFAGITDGHSLARADDQRSNHKDRRGPGPVQCWISPHWPRHHEPASLPATKVALDERTSCRPGDPEA